nr:LpqN/LpqT family lipoprotein [Mycobacterium sp. D16R24]
MRSVNDLKVMGIEEGLLAVRKCNRTAVAVFCVAVVVAGCSSRQSPSDTSDTPAASVTASSTSAAPMDGCVASDVPRVTLDAKAPGEPVLAVPAPQGWEYSAAMNSPLIRGAVANIGLRANDFTPNAVVTLEDLTGKVASAQQGVEAEIVSVEQGGMAVESRAAGTVCGHPSSTITYTLQNRPVTALIAAVEDGHKIWATVLTIQTTEPANPAYTAGKRSILDGFQFTVPGNSH